MELNLNLTYATLITGLPSTSSSKPTNYSNLKSSVLKTQVYQSPAPSVDIAKLPGDVEKKSDALKDSADILIAKGADSLFQQTNITTTEEDGTQTTVKDYDRDSLYHNVKNFIEDYNALIDSASDSSNTSVLRQTLSLTSYTGAYANALGNTGITIGKNNHLSIDEESFKESDMNTIKAVFNDTNSYAYTVSAKSSQINYYAGNEDNKIDTYSPNGVYSNRSNAYSVGSLYNSCS
ncbi:MAG: hypothetical protein RRX92_09165 [Lachnospiraceae bacterium]